MREPMTEPDALPPPADVTPIHPEEMKASFDFRIGDKIALQATARTTPAGIVSVGIATAAILLATTFLVRSCSRSTSR